MKINVASFQSMLPKPMKEHAAEAADAAAITVKQQHVDARKALKDEIQRQIAKIQAAQFDKGEDDPRVQLLIDKFKSGKKLTQNEMAYMRQNAPGMMDYIERISREREMVELSMRIAPSKLDVLQVVLLASKQIAKQPDSEERAVRAMQLADAHNEYMQTDEYKDKPDSPLDHREKRATLRRGKENLTNASMAIAAYEQVKLVKNETTSYAMNRLLTRL